jgi:hypothetical protein
VVAYCRSGRVKFADSRYTSAAFDMLELRVQDGRLDFHVDYDKGSDRRVSGEITIGMTAPDADAVALEIAERLAPRPRRMRRRPAPRRGLRRGAAG